MSTWKRYTSRRPNIKAVQLTAENILDVFHSIDEAEWFRAGEGITVPVVGGTMTAKTGDFIAMFSDGSYRVFPSDKFTQDYEPAGKTYTKPL